MVDPITSQRWGYRALYAVLCGLVLFVQVLPGTMIAGRWPGPDFLMAITLVWGLRRPDFLPPWLIALVFLTGDLIEQRPPGLWAALMVLAVEFLRGRIALWRDLPFMLEWAVISALMAGLLLAYWGAHELFLIDQASFGLYVIRLLATILVYPVVVAASALLLGIRKVGPGELERMGHTL